MKIHLLFYFSIFEYLFYFVACETLFPELINERVPAADLESSLYPEWANYHWVWLSHGAESQTAEIDLVEGYESRGIRVGAVDIDSEWSTGINNFIWDTKKFPNASNMIDYFHKKNIRVICWATSMVDETSSNYKHGYDKGYYLDDGLVAKWWHGWGSFLDYTNPDALVWWHDQLDLVLDIGLDGWKTDGTDAILFELGGIALGHSGLITEREYATMYYSDFFFYSRSKNPEALIMSRPVDSWKDLYLKFAPRNVVFAGWVGDQDPNFSGMQDALRNMFHSAWDKYLNFGSDTGGYRSGTRTKDVFLRWAQMSAFTTLFENGGDGPHAPWEFDNQTVEVYRTLVNIHYELVPYYLSTALECWNNDVSVMKPIADYTIFTPSSWDFYIGKDIFVAPIVENGTQRTVKFPNDGNWLGWFDGKIYSGGSTVKFNVPISNFTVFKRQGSIMPLDVTTSDTNHGDKYSTNCYTILINSPLPGLQVKKIIEWKASGALIGYNYTQNLDQIELTSTAHKKEMIYFLRGIQFNSKTQILSKVPKDHFLEKINVKPELCNRQLALLRKGWCVKSKNEIIIRPGKQDLGNKIIIENIKGGF